MTVTIIKQYIDCPVYLTFRLMVCVALIMFALAIVIVVPCDLLVADISLIFLAVLWVCLYLSNDLKDVPLLYFCFIFSYRTAA